LAAALGDGDLYLTSRGNVQVRGLRSGAELELSEGLFTIGLFPSASHERVRNIAASPLAGLDTVGLTELRRLITELDSRLCRRPALAALSGRFLFGLDDGRGDITALGADICARAVASASFALVIAGRDTGVRLGPDAVIGAMLDAAEAFLRLRAEQGSQAWRITDLAAGIVEPATPELDKSGVNNSTVPTSRPTLGTVRQPDGRVALLTVPPLGRITPPQLAALSNPQLVITPWRSIVLPDLTADQAADKLPALRAAGLAVDADSTWLGVSACTGKPGCAKALADVRADATAVHGPPAAHSPDVRAPDGPDGHNTRPSVAVHWAGCERRCGHPGGDTTTVLATGSGYRVSNGAQSLDVDADPRAVSRALVELSRTR
jgi:precorrin-3B synthase